MTSSTKRRLLIDLETYSSADITKTGAFKYAEAPDFEILLLACAWDDGPVQVIDMTDREPVADERTAAKAAALASVVAGITDPDTVKVAHNSAFERACLTRYLGRDLPPEEWEDTMILAAMNGLPLSLDAAGAALELRDQKIREGTALISYFCKPCKPTIANGGRTRNRPEHAPDKWERFKAYCKRDVEVEQAIYRRLRSFPVTDFERKVWALDARINERGVRIDTGLVAAAIAQNEAFTTRHMAEMRRLTGLENPNSVAQLKDWLETAGMSADSLNKAAVQELKDKATDPATRRVLELRQQLGKTSVTKYEAMQNAVCADGRVRGLLQYYGAGRTGRWAGRLVQVQNLPQNHLAGLGLVRELVRERDLETLELCFDSVPDVLSQLIRTAFVAGEGNIFHVADYSAIEARVIAYLAGEKWRMDVFRSGGDIYCSSASAMFRVPVVKHGVNGHLRQKGKIAELACIAEGQLVLTDGGLVPIEDVTTGMKVWDGIEWVSHGGVICKGEKEVLTYGGLEATANHIVWVEVEGQPGQIRFGDAPASGARLIQTGAGRRPLRVGGDNQPGETVERAVEPLLRLDEVQRMRSNTVAGTGEPSDRKVERVPELLPTESCSALAGQTIHGGKTAMHQPEGRKLQELRSAGHRVPLSERDGGLPLHDRDEWAALSGDGAGQNQRKRSLRTGESAVGDASGELSEPTALPRKVKVYDILNAGPRHRFTVSGVLVHNCGYGGGVGALRAFGADKMGLTEEEMQDIVTQWRAASPTIPRFWRDAESAAVRAINNPGRTTTVPCGVKYRRDGDALRCRLPSGRILSYWDAKLDTDGSICFMGQNQTTRRWEKTGTWGGKLVENIVQAYARDCLAVAMVRLAEEGWKICFHVHDEVIVEAPIGTSWEQVAEVMGRPIDWAPGLLLRGDGYSTPFYRKD